MNCCKTFHSTVANKSKSDQTRQLALPSAVLMPNPLQNCTISLPLSLTLCLALQMSSCELSVEWLWLQSWLWWWLWLKGNKKNARCAQKMKMWAKFCGQGNSKLAIKLCPRLQLQLQFLLPRCGLPAPPLLLLLLWLWSAVLINEHPVKRVRGQSRKSRKIIVATA